MTATHPAPAPLRPRDALREARAHAEAWHAVLRDWRPVRLIPIRPNMSYAAFRDDDLTDTLGSIGPTRPSWLPGPNGWHVRETEAAALISAWCESSIPAQREHGQLLDRVRQGRGPRTLLDPRGGWAGGCNARAYAVAVLTLAVSLGDGMAAAGLGSLRKAD